MNEVLKKLKAFLICEVTFHQFSDFLLFLGCENDKLKDSIAV